MNKTKRDKISIVHITNSPLSVKLYKLKYLGRTANRVIKAQKDVKRPKVYYLFFNKGWSTMEYTFHIKVHVL